ncbi:precorrin-4 C(11)-methyltransferase [uncultured Fretibacterium sp.]|uniref:precorrin-4 C(11)-methyltransferase n=1 Tax=uncultured Fretibacterium sp. TaxID=1678694 RepID=UPI00262589EA|nr:precorrin-4 C(11)-methyltransferase [uncultured Fretibacterium sp.]
MIYFIGAGPGAPDLITLRGAELLRRAGMIVYAGSLVNPALLDYAPQGCEVYDSALMTLDEVMEKLLDGERRGLTTVRLHTGDPSLYGAIREQMDRLRAEGVEFSVVPGVSSFCAAAAAIPAEYTLPGVSQTLIISRMEGRTPVPAREGIRSLAAHGASMVLFLSSAMLKELASELIAGGYPPETPAALVYKASWPDERVLRGPLASIPAMAEEAGISKTALVLVGGFLGDEYDLSRLYDASFSHGCRRASQ